MPAPLTRRGVQLGFLVSLTCLLTVQAEAQSSTSVRAEMYRRYLEFPSYVKGGKVEPHWMADGSSFWYAEDAPANTVIWKVDPEANTKEPLFDTEHLRKALAQALGHEPPYKGLPFEVFAFADPDQRRVRFSVEGKEFLLNLDSYAVTPAPVSLESETRHWEPQITRKGDTGYPDLYEVRSPDGKWLVGLKDHDLWLRSTSDGRSSQLTADGVEDYEWGALPWSLSVVWSPDSRKLAVQRRDFRDVPKIPIVHYLNPIEEVQWVHHAFVAGMPTDRHELYVIDITSKRRVRIKTGEAPYEHLDLVRWLPDGLELLLRETDRYGRNIRLAAAEPNTGSTRDILIVSREAPDVSEDPHFTLLEDGKRFIWRSNRDGWHHLYLYGIDGKLLGRLTEGEFPVVRVVAVDEDADWVYFVARTDRKRPYDTHLCRVKLDGSGFAQLTDEPGQHDIQLLGEALHRAEFSPDRRFFLDSHSSRFRPPSVDLRSADGTLLRTLSRADIEALKELRWRPPEEFVVKGPDGRTDLYGTLYKPHDIDPGEKYPVIQMVNAAGDSRARTFTGPPLFYDWHRWAQALAQLGFVVFGVDTHTAWPKGVRGREFEKLLYGNLGRYEIPEQIATLKALGAKRPYMDLDRVGIVGGSYSGYYAVRSLLVAPDTYHVGIAIAPILDLYTQAYYLWLGPLDTNKEAYDYASNYRLASNLKGKLLLIHGTNDLEVPISQTMRMVDAFVRANRPFDLMILPEWGHWGNERTENYWMDRVVEYFQEHLRP